VLAIAAGATRSVALKTDASVVVWGASGFGPTIAPAGLPPVLAIAAGYYHYVAIVRDPPPSLTILRNADQTLSLSWTGAGALEETATLGPPIWEPAAAQTNPQSLSATGAMKYFRVKGD
jgi:hypothetical protein